MSQETTLRSSLIRLAHENPSFRADLLPLLKEAASPAAGYYVRKYPGGNRYIWVEDVAQGYVAGTGTYTQMDPDEDGKGPKAADLDMEEKDLKAWKKVPENKVPENWKKWFAKNRRTAKTADLSLAINQIRLSYEGLMGTMEELGAYIEMEDARAIPTAREAARALAELSDDLRRGGVVYRRAGTEG